ncbi:MAG: hypothetical protein Q8Q40_09880 [Methylococcaceae bacterium]|nr:hypothetical protein [Methylococcaceae bacterium]MDP3904272.1 hypothetical protein [Methylococcaceae bacterium]
MSKYHFPQLEMREALREALPSNDQTAADPTRNPQFTYVPPSHARALDPENTIVEGIRGAGKSHWWAVLNSGQHRDYLASVFPETRITRNLIVSQGFGVGLGPKAAPGKDTLASLVKEHDPRHIWQAVIAVHAGFPEPFPNTPGKWTAMVNWVKENPEDFDNLLDDVDFQLAQQNKTHLILFDALDRLGNDWPSIRPLARSLFQLALDMRARRAIRLKLFVRTDMLEDRGILAFPDSSKLLAKKVPLVWRRVDLYALLFQCLGNADAQGEMFRFQCERLFYQTWKQDENTQAWQIPQNMRTDEDLQREIFHAITGYWMGSGPKRGAPYTWLPNHLIDGRDQVSPRSFAAALRYAVENDQPHTDTWPWALHYRAIQAGVQEASRIRVDEITREDYPWVETLMQPLRSKITVPCEPKEIIQLWKNDKTISKLQTACEENEVRLPPPHIEDGEKGILQDLADLGVIQLLADRRIQMPDVYRIAFGFGRRGGVKPLK